MQTELVTRFLVEVSQDTLFCAEKNGPRLEISLMLFFTSERCCGGEKFLLFSRILDFHSSLMS